MNASAQRETTISQPQGKKNITYIIHIQHKEGKRKREFVFYLNTQKNVKNRNTIVWVVQ